MKKLLTVLIATTAMSLPAMAETPYAGNAEMNTQMRHSSERFERYDAKMHRDKMTHENKTHQSAAPYQTKTSMKYGTLGQRDVMELQQALNNEGYSAGDVDGVWGSQTTAALRHYQSDHNMSATGNLDVRTAKALDLDLQAPLYVTAPAPVQTETTVIRREIEDDSYKIRVEPEANSYNGMSYNN